MPVPRRPPSPARRRGWWLAGGLTLLLATAACASDASGSGSGSGSRGGPDSTSAPALGACHRLTPTDTARSSSDVAAVPCAGAHTAQTYAVGTFPAATFASAAYDARSLGRFVYRTCNPALTTFLGSDDSEIERSLFSWAWFRPSEKAWSKGARWYRCDVVSAATGRTGDKTTDRTGGKTTYRALPVRTKNLLGGAPVDAWMLCARGSSVEDAKVPCAEKHDWRAVTTIKLGQPDDPYPGDRLVQIRSQQYCSDSVGAWLNYPASDFDYAMTIYHRAEWTAGNRRTVCWARTTR